jgi:hypothetical protein
MCRMMNMTLSAKEVHKPKQERKRKGKSQPVSQSKSLTHLSTNRDDFNGPVRLGSALAGDVLVVDSDALCIEFTIQYLENN